MKYLLALGLCFLVIQQSVAPPVNQEEKNDEPEKETATKDPVDSGYKRYLDEVVQALHKDPELRKKLDKASQDDINSGKIAHELNFADHNVRTQLNEIKRREIKRLKDLARKENELTNSLDIEHMKIHEHLDHANDKTFEVEDLKKLITKATKDLEEVDKKRKEEFKKHEMEKKFEEEQKIKGITGLDEEGRQKYEKELHDLEEKRKNHEPLHHPGRKQQLEEVWEEQDHMEGADFDPASFFQMHDLDSNGVWDPIEVEALFIKEVDKIYPIGGPGFDPVERAEEIARMREHTYKEIDLNKDGLVSFHELMEQSKRPDFEQEDGWDTLDKQKQFSPEEYDEFLKQRQEEMKRMIDQGMLPPIPDSNGYPQQIPSQGQYVHYPQEIPNQQVPYHGQHVQQPQYQQHSPQVPGQQGYVPQQAVPQQQDQQKQGQVPQQQQGQVAQQQKTVPEVNQV